MAALEIPTIYDKNAVLIADDEPEHLEWLVDFLQSIGLAVTVATNVKEAMDAGQGKWFRIYIIDLNIPLGGWPDPTIPIFISYPGFTIIQGIRSQGNDGRRVIAYSAHSNDQITSEMQRLYTDYIAKGRPIQLKERLKELLTEPDLTAASLKRVNARIARRNAAIAAKKTAAKAARRTAAPPSKKRPKPLKKRSTHVRTTKTSTIKKTSKLKK